MIDLLLVILLMCGIQIYFGDYQVSQTLFQRSLQQFEEKVSASEVVESHYVSAVNDQDNQVGNFFQYISDKCVAIIQFIVLIFSNIVSLIL